MLELYKTAVRAIKFYCACNVYSSSLAVKPILSLSKLEDLQVLTAVFQTIKFFWDMTPCLWVSAPDVS